MANSYTNPAEWHASLLCGNLPLRVTLAPKFGQRNSSPKKNTGIKSLASQNIRLRNDHLVQPNSFRAFEGAGTKARQQVVADHVENTAGLKCNQHGPIPCTSHPLLRGIGLRPKQCGASEGTLLSTKKQQLERQTTSYGPVSNLDRTNGCFHYDLFKRVLTSPRKIQVLVRGSVPALES